MIKSSWRLSRICIRHGIQPNGPRRFLAVPATVPRDQKSTRRSSTSHGSNHNDYALRQLFDSQEFWHDFSQNSRVGSRRGLLQNLHLTEPKSFVKYAQLTVARCQKIVEYVLSASSPEEYIVIPKKLDLLSDCLCRVLDTADFIRATHPDVHFQDSATQAYTYLFQYMNILNTTPGLDTQLKKAIGTAENAGAWSEEEKTVAQILLKDFAQSAINLSEDERKKFVKLSSDVKQLGNEFVEAMVPKESHVDLDASQLKGMDPLILRKYSTTRNQFSLPTVGEAQHAALGSIQNEHVRRAIYIAGRQCPQRQIQRLEKLMETRAKIASLSGHKSYAHMSLSDKLAKTPEAVTSFLMALSADNAPKVKEELAKMEELKIQDGRSPEVRPWDILYYRNRLNTKVASRSRKPDFMAAYFSLGTVMQGLSRLFTRLYGIRFVPRETTAGETWNTDVRRLDVIHEDAGHVAVLYCDLFARAGKTPNPTHFTLRCSRLITSSEIAESNGSPEEANDGMAISSPSSTDQYHQLPTIALVCDFAQRPSRSSPTLLTFQDLRTLFHEMGHAIHSILGRTSLQIVSGTRCPTDFAELPSVLMESFASDASVLALFARHWETDVPLPYEMVENALQMIQRGQGLQMENQILFSLLDQAYHSSLPLTMDGGFDSTKVFFDIYEKYNSVREPRDTNAQGLFGHLVEYGGTYYSYLFDRAIAGKLWKEVFREGKDGGGVDREAGERYKEEVLKWGGARSGWACISGVLRHGKLKEGGKEAMEEVGRWGVHD